MIMIIDGRHKTSQVGVPCDTKVLREFIFAIGDFFVSWKIIFATSTHWFFLLRINFLRFSKSIQYPALIMFSFLLSTCNQGVKEIHIFKQY